MRGGRPVGYKAESGVTPECYNRVIIVRYPTGQYRLFCLRRLGMRLSCLPLSRYRSTRTR